MQDLPHKLVVKLKNRVTENTFRALGNLGDGVDFSSNDYLGFATNQTIYQKALALLEEHKLKENGAKGSRLLTGNHHLYGLVEHQLKAYYEAESALIFNSGYSANHGFFSAIPQRDDVVFYDALIHASIRDGINSGSANSIKFTHNNLADLKARLQRLKSNENRVVYVVTESVFSMDGDSPDLLAFAQFCQQNNCKLIVDEAHAIGVFGAGLVVQQGLQQSVFARIITFGKALGCHGAAVLGSAELNHFLVNFCRPFIYTTALAPHAIATIYAAHEHIKNSNGSNHKISSLENLAMLISTFQQQVKTISAFQYIPSHSAIQCIVIPGVVKVKALALYLQQLGFQVKPILAPTVPEGQERLRFCLHSYNTVSEIEEALQLVQTFNEKI